MSLRTVTTITCDTCGAMIIGPKEESSTRIMESYAAAKMCAQRLGWIVKQKYGKSQHICQPCADGKPGSGPATIVAGSYFEEFEHRYERTQLTKPRNKKI